MWTWVQRSGELFRADGALEGIGYSGKGTFKNLPDQDHVANLGPLPKGQYRILAPVTRTALGPYVMFLVPQTGNQMHGRSSFAIHGDNKTHTASKGCIVLPRDVRERIWKSGDVQLRVVGERSDV